MNIIIQLSQDYQQRLSLPSIKTKPGSSSLQKKKKLEDFSRRKKLKPSFVGFAFIRQRDIYKRKITTVKSTYKNIILGIFISNRYIYPK